jgi:dCMP deaminase
VGLEGAELYCTNQPCLPCAQTIINSGISKVWFCEPYRLRDGRELLEEARIEVIEYLDFSMPS